MTVQEGRDRCMNVYIHNLPPKACMPLERKPNCRTLEDSAWEMLQNAQWCTFHLCNHEHKPRKHEHCVTDCTTKMHILVWTLLFHAGFQTSSKWFPELYVRKMRTDGCEHWHLPGTVIMALHCRWGSHMPESLPSSCSLGQERTSLLYIFFRFGVLGFFR